MLPGPRDLTNDRQLAQMVTQASRMAERLETLHRTMFVGMLSDDDAQISEPVV